MYHGQIVSSYNSLFGTWDARIPVLPRIAYATRHICPFHCSLNRRPRDSLASLALVVITTRERYVMVYVTAVKILSIKRDSWYREGVGIEVS